MGGLGQTHIDLFVPFGRGVGTNRFFRATTNATEATERTRSRHRVGITNECDWSMRSVSDSRTITRRREEAPRTTTKPERTIWEKATTRSARAKLIKILRILLIHCSNFVQETPAIFTFCRFGQK